MRKLVPLLFLAALSMGCYKMSLIRTSPLSIPGGTPGFRKVGTIMLPGVSPGSPSGFRLKLLGARSGKIALIKGKKAYLIDSSSQRIYHTISLDEKILDVFAHKPDRHLYLFTKGKIGAYDPQAGKVLWMTPIAVRNYLLVIRRYRYMKISTVSYISTRRLKGTGQLLLIGSGGNRLGIDEDNNLAIWLDVQTGKIIKQRKFEHRMALGRGRELHLNARTKRLNILNLDTGRIEYSIPFDREKDVLLTSKLQAASNYTRFHDFYYLNYLNARQIGNQLYLFSWHYDNAFIGVNSLKARLAVYDLATGNRLRVESDLPPTTPAYAPRTYFDRKQIIKDIVLPYFSPRRERFRYNLAGFLRWTKKGPMQKLPLPDRENFKNILAKPRANCYRYNDSMLFFDNKGSLQSMNLRTGKVRWEYKSIGKIVKWRAFGHYMVLGYDKETALVTLKGRRALLRRFPKYLLINAIPDLKRNFIMLALVNKRRKPFKPEMVGMDLTTKTARFRHRPPEDYLGRRMAYLGAKSDFFYIEILPGGKNRVLTRLDTRTGRIRAMLPLDYYKRGRRTIYPLKYVMAGKKVYILTYATDRVDIYHLY